MANHTFEQYGLKPFIYKGIEALRFKEPTPIQRNMIPLILKGESAIGQSQTGTGKTHSYVLPILNRIQPEKKEVQAVITAPTRELATQIYQAFQKVANESEEEIAVRHFVGGTDKKRDVERLKNPPHIMVGTPGRIADLIGDNAISVHKADMLVVDEADLMLDMGFINDVDRIASGMPEKLGMFVFSATIPQKLKPFLKKYMENPEYIHIEPKRASAANIEHMLVPAKSRDKVDVVADLLKSFNPYLAVVFTNTKQKADEVADKLSEKGFKTGRIHGDLPPRERKKMMKQVHDLEYRYIVATDLAARGIDIEGVSHVINYELPPDLDFYIHRAGRTARAGASGICATVYLPADEDAIAKLEKRDIDFSNREIRAGEIVETADRNRRKKREKKDDAVNPKVRAVTSRPQKVKPGYKKKRKMEVAKIEKRQRRIDARNKR
ncbi:DEAD/DEAH box helicase [Domibacillus enclensis]|uniref:DEAD-box ATP-dependent RNA helicase CshB n=1 Tax=Domibacillus enclensis TaxID=1017273 RepID=A0A1N6PMY6_9BACI|nr:DEAD/DEAH box helicase [Domibacillus enclensis]OXS80424.1 DEAD/DEAH box helicase [Domibacillus enclensis]SIQ05697.1 ATP-dependent RNA helicase CshB [Domibacillus enclensis]